MLDMTLTVFNIFSLELLEHEHYQLLYLLLEKRDPHTVVYGHCTEYDHVLVINKILSLFHVCACGSGKTYLIRLFCHFV